MATAALLSFAHPTTPFLSHAPSSSARWGRFPSSPLFLKSPLFSSSFSLKGSSSSVGIGALQFHLDRGALLQDSCATALVMGGAYTLVLAFDLLSSHNLIQRDYTGLSPAAFFTILALMIAVYHVVSGMFVAPDDHLNNHPRAVPEPFVPPEPVQLGDVTEEELRAYDGSDPKKPLLMAIKGQIYDVSMSRLFYGPGGPYALFAGRDASRALALMSFNPNDLTGNTEGLGPSELETLRDWELKFMEKYAKVGQIVKEKTTSGDIVRSEKPECSEEPNKESENIVKDLGKLEENGEKTEGSMEWSKQTENINKDSGKFEENGQKTECSEEPKKETENISKDSGIIDETAAGKI